MVQLEGQDSTAVDQTNSEHDPNTEKVKKNAIYSDEKQRENSQGNPFLSSYKTTPKPLLNVKKWDVEH